MTSDDQLLGRHIGSYQIERELGRGGMGTVYLATHPTIGKKIAIKVLKRELSKDEAILQRFFHEAKAANDIRHQNVVDVLDVGRTEEGHYYLLMEYLSGVTLFDALRSHGRFAPGRVGHVGLQLCSALAAAHQRGIIHRDLKADNVFLISSTNQKDFVKLLDFGIAKLLEFEVDGRGLTQEGFVMGTPAYMSPEQALGFQVDQQSDIYSLGVILYQMATCSLPFADSNPVVVATMHVSAELPLPSERCPDISPALEAVILKCLEKHKEDRYKTMMELALDLSLSCRVDPRPYFEPELQQRLGMLLAAKQTPATAPEAVSLEPTVQSVVFGVDGSIGQENTQQAEAMPAVMIPTLKLSPRLKRLSGIGIAVALCGSLLAGLLYWGVSSPALASASMLRPPAAPMIETRSPFAEMLVASTPEPIKAPEVARVPESEARAESPVVSAPEKRPAKPKSATAASKKPAPKKTPPPPPSNKTKLIDPFTWGPKRR